MLEPKEILNLFSGFFKEGKLSSKKILITAGPTQEPLDPVRYITNRSSGKMGYALANASIEAGAEVILISGPTSLEIPEHLHFVRVKTANEMYKAVIHYIESTDIFISAAAVSDYRPSDESKYKIKKNEGRAIRVDMEENIDILKSVSSLTEKPFLVGL